MGRHALDGDGAAFAASGLWRVGGYTVSAGAAAATTTDAAPRKRGKSYVVLQTILKEKVWGTGSGNLTELENAINAQAARGYRLHTISTAVSGSKGLGGGDRIQATMVFEAIEP